MTPTPTTQQELDTLERIGKVVGSLAIIGGTVAALVRWLRRRRAAREAQYAARIERIVRAAFADELRNLDRSCSNITHVTEQVDINVNAIESIRALISTSLTAGDEMLGLMLSLVRANSDWLDDLQSFIDHAHGIDRRSSIAADRRQIMDQKYDAIEERRALRRRASDKLRDLGKDGKDGIAGSPHNEVT